ncbi:immunoglobulin lambda-1 light chain-like [Paroedura picta]|uniref:immunoglobulin lambda-1 light chain-like n=1 Tax=Paroedura picta TaxID=143630 RepID=UPI0040568D78
MAPTLLMLAIFACYSGMSSGASLTQPPSQSESLGQTARLPCTISGSISNFHWVRQRPGQGPHFVIYGSSRGEGIPDRFTDSSSGSNRHLTISNVQAEDEADYYCVSWDSSGSQCVFGGGTQLIVTGQPSVPPTVMLFPPSPEEIQTRNKATLVCLITEFNPGAIQVAWLADGKLITEGVETAKPTKQNDKYVASSYLTMSDTDWNGSEAYTCKVTHEERVIEKLVRRSECP